MNQLLRIHYFSSGGEGLNYLSLILWIVAACLALALAVWILALLRLFVSRLLFIVKLKKKVKKSNLTLKVKRCPLRSIFLAYAEEDLLILDGDQILYKVKLFPHRTARRVILLSSGDRYIVQRKLAFFLHPQIYNSPSTRRIVDVSPRGVHPHRYSSLFSEVDGQRVMLFHPEPLELLDERGNALGHGSEYAGFKVFTPEGFLHTDL